MWGLLNWKSGWSLTAGRKGLSVPREILLEVKLLWGWRGVSSGEALPRSLPIPKELQTRVWCDSEGGNVGETGMSCFVGQKTQIWHQKQAATTIIKPKLLQQSHRANTCSYFHRSCPTFCYPDPSFLPFNYRVITSVVYVPVCFPSEGISISSTEISDTPHTRQLTPIFHFNVVYSKCHCRTALKLLVTAWHCSIKIWVTSPNCVFQHFIFPWTGWFSPSPAF